MVIFGATGDLTNKKLLPALFNLYCQGLFSANFLILGVSRRAIDREEFAARAGKILEKNAGKFKNKIKTFVSKLNYTCGFFEDDATYINIKKIIKEFEKEQKGCRLLYLATPPHFYQTIIEKIVKFSLDKTASTIAWVRVLIEKPFGKDLKTAQMLDRFLGKNFAENQIYRIDHYLSKETVQNIIAFRFANGIFEPIWNNNYIDHVQITLAEREGVGGRGSFYEGVGALRDVSQNHLLQLLSTIIMEQPKSFSAEGVRDARAKAIKSIKQIDPSDISRQVVRGQYRGYSQEKNVHSQSATETFVAMKLYADNDKFSNVPFYLRSGKKLAKDIVEISLVFKQVCHLLFKEVGCPEEGNRLTIQIQPNEGIKLRFIAKEPGPKMKLASIDMGFNYKQVFKTKTGIDPYVRILQDVFLGDQMLFNRSDELSTSWELIGKIMDSWKKNNGPLYSYSGDTWGPQEADKLIENDGRKWTIDHENMKTTNQKNKKF